MSAAPLRVVNGYCQGRDTTQARRITATKTPAVDKSNQQMRSCLWQYPVVPEMTSEFSAADLAIIRKTHPEAWVDPMPSIDEIVVEFLRLHEINVMPASSDIAPSRMTNAAMGAMGPAYLAANTHLTQQAKTAALQEWISWKQWALSHKDFPPFKDKVRQRYHERRSMADAFIAKNSDGLKIELTKFRESRKKEQKAIWILAISLVALLALITELPKFIDSLNSPTPRERRKTDQSSINPSATPTSASQVRRPSESPNPPSPSLSDELNEQAAREEKHTRDFIRMHENHDREMAEIEANYRRRVDAIYAKMESGSAGSAEHQDSVSSPVISVSTPESD